MKSERQRIWVVVALVLAFASNGVTAGKSKDWDGVRVTDDDQRVEGCEYIGEVKGKSGWGGLMAQNLGEEKAYKHLKRNAWKLGGDTVLLLFGRSGFGGSKYRGEVYSCENRVDTETAMIVLGGIRLCEPEQASLDYLSIQQASGHISQSGETEYEFDLPVDLGLGDLEPNSATLTTKAGIVSEVSAVWAGLSSGEQEQLWKTLDEAFSETKGQPDSFDSARYWKAWREVGNKKMTQIEWDTGSGELRISTSCTDPGAIENVKDAAVDGGSAAAAF